MEKSIKESLRELLSHKQSKHYYASKLGIPERLVERLIHEIREEDRGAIVEPGGEEIRMVSEKRTEEGDREVQYLSVKPLDRKEIEKLYGIDGINTKLSSYWNKQTSSGKYLVSAFVKCLVSDFYTKEELAEQLKEIFPNLKPVSLKVVPSTSSKALFIYTSDDHCGNVIKSSIYGKEYSESIYVKRLLTLSNEVKKLEQEFEEVFIINMGDEVDGWNGKTTRYDHDLVESLSNKEQFNIYTTGRRIFYDDILTSGVAPKYTIISLNNSNHSGKGLSYILNKSMEFYLQARYNNVSMLNFDRFIDTIKYGNHLIGLTHGKDEQLMKSPLPLNLDAKTDLWLLEYYDKLGYSPSKSFISTMKGDIHRYNSNIGKSGRYINCPSIAGGSGYIELNFGDTRAGALLEIVEKNSPNIFTLPIWFN